MLPKFKEVLSLSYLSFPQKSCRASWRSASCRRSGTGSASVCCFQSTLWRHTGETWGHFDHRQPKKAKRKSVRRILANKRARGAEQPEPRSHPASELLGERLHEVADAVPSHYRVVKDELFVAVLLLLDVKTVGHQWVPVIQGVEFGCDAVLVLEILLEQQLWVKLELEMIAAQVLDVVFDHNLDGLSYKIMNSGMN